MCDLCTNQEKKKNLHFEINIPNQLGNVGLFLLTLFIFLVFEFLILVMLYNKVSLVNIS